MPEKTPMTQSDAERIVEAETKKNDGFAERALTAAAKNASKNTNAGSGQGTGLQGNNNGGGTGKK